MAESDDADFNIREHKLWPLLLKFIGEQDSGKKFASRVSHVAMASLAMFTNFDFLSIFLHKLRTNC